MIATHVPTPAESQRERAHLLYSGDVDDECGQGIASCDASAPAVVYVCKMCPSNRRRKKYLAFGRVFSGQIRPGDTLRALQTDGTETNAKISQIIVCGIGDKMESVGHAEAGQLIALEGVDEALGKAGTLTNSSTGHPVRHMHFSVAPVVQHSIKPKDKTKATKMITELRHIVKADSTARFFTDRETKEHILAGAGELHIEILVSSLLENSGIEVELSEPIIAYRESIMSASKQAALAKSENKHNRVWFKASPLADEMVDLLSSPGIGNEDIKALGQMLMNRCGWSSNEASRIWATGPALMGSADESGSEDQPTCLLVDGSFGLQVPQDAKDNIISAFMQVVSQGILVNSPMRGVCFELIDAKFHADTVHRRPNSVVPAAMKAMRGAFLMADPILVEPMYQIDICGAPGSLNAVYSILGWRSGIVVDSSSTVTTDVIKARLPVRCSFGLTGELRGATHGHAHCSCAFDGMQPIPSQEQEEVVRSTRSSKLLDDSVPIAESFLDRL